MIPYLFLLYYYPLRELIKNKEFKDICFTAICAAVIGNAIFMAFSLFGFSSGMFVLQDYYYHWFRDVASGKITDLGMGYFRLVLNEHLLLIPMLLYFIYKIIREKAISVLNISIAVLLLFILSINLSRIYLLALAVGLLFFFTKSAWKRWLVICASTAVAFMLVFTCTHLIATRGQSLGWEVFGLRIQSIVQPQIEDSSLSRMLLLPKIWEKIKTHTILGNGLGDTVTVYSPVLEQKISTPHFDWGYFELWDELGMLGIVIWALLIVYIFRGLYQAKEHDNIYFISALASIIIMNITSPALFHVMGLLFIAITATSFQKINSN
ncbi:O-antigen ligase family protein [Patescibacteria group bacterium]|nr:O-antigen ligase family protein [Patescibacteria group bacterium]